MRILIQEANIVNEGNTFLASVLIENEIIQEIITSQNRCEEIKNSCDKVIIAHGQYLLPGIIDDQVHFREPGATHKGCIETESAAAVLGGVTSFMDMPNNNPPVCTLNALEEKYKIAEEKAYANYSFYLGANNDNISEIKAINPKKVCGVKVFMGSSTGNMLVDKEETLEEIFKNAPTLIATHCEDEATIKANLETAKAKFGDDIPFSEHPNIRSREACILSSKKAIALAQHNNSRLHILHVSTADEIQMIDDARKTNPNISAEVCVHYLFFNDKDYPGYGTKVKCNPAIKKESDMLSLREACNNGKVHAIATDHAPHLFSEKDQNYLKAPSGLPLVQHSLRMMLELSRKGVFSIEKVVELMCHAPAKTFQIEKRGFIKEGYYADLVLLKDIKDTPEIVSKENIAYHCAWSPLEGKKLSYKVTDVLVNGALIVENSKLTGNKNSKRLTFNR